MFINFFLYKEKKNLKMLFNIYILDKKSMNINYKFV